MSQIIGYPGRALPQSSAINLGVQNPSSAGTQQVSASYPSLVKTGYGNLPVALAAGQVFIIPPGNWILKAGRYTFLQWYDTNAQIWRNYKTSGIYTQMNSDGVNFRLANCTGCPVGTVITNHGTGYTSAPTAAASLGGSTWRCILGAALNSTVTITEDGTSAYTLPPILVIDPPPAGGLQATATCTISAGVINAVTVTNQGAGYTSVPKITVVNAPGDTTGAGAILTPALIANATAGGADTVCAVVPVTYGTARTAVPTLTFSGGAGSGLAATVIMCLTCLTATNTGQSHSANGGAALIGSAYTTGNIAPFNRDIQENIFTPEMGYTEFVGTLAGNDVFTQDLAGSAPFIVYGGLHQALPRVVSINNSDGTISAATTWANTVGGITDQSWMQLLD